MFTAVNLLGSFIFLLSVAGTYRVTGMLAMHDVAERMPGVDPNAAILVAAGFFIAFSVKLGPVPLPLLAADGLRGLAARGRGHPQRRRGEHRGVRAAAVRSRHVPRPAAARGHRARRARRGVVVYGAVLAVARGRRRGVAGLLRHRAGRVRPGRRRVSAVPSGLTAAVLYSVVNALNKTLLFLAVEIRGALVAGAFAVGALSVAGVPPAAGFVGKLEMFRAGIVVGSASLVVLLVVGSALSLVYMFQVYQRTVLAGGSVGAGTGQLTGPAPPHRGGGADRARHRPVARAAAGGQRPGGGGVDSPGRRDEADIVRRRYR